MIDPTHFAPLFPRKPRAQVMLYRDLLCDLGGHAPAFLASLSRRHRARLRAEVLAVYAPYEHYGADNLRAAMALADEAGTYSADALALLLDAPRSVPPSLPSLALPGGFHWVVLR